jgi:1,4-dihydroxy-2-naphthoate polyprenyltransferase
MRQVKLWLGEIRANFLLLPVALVSLGTAAAYHDARFDVVLFILTLAGVILAHISVNLFNEYSDWKTGIDAHTIRTPFSGGSGNLPQELLNPFHVHRAAWLALGTAFFIGVFLAYRAGWPVLVIAGIGGFATVFYTEKLSRWTIGEAVSGLTLGSLVVIGSYYVQTGRITPPLVWLSVPPGLLTSLVLFLNEFPDVEADRAGGRRHLVIVLGSKAASYLYASCMALTYLLIGIGILLKLLPFPLFISFLTIPIAWKAVQHAICFHDNVQKLVPALGMNVATVLLTDFLLAVGYLIS